MDDERLQRFGAWLAARLGVGAVDLGAIERPKAGGLSSETWLLDADWGPGPRGLVVRLPPAGEGLFPKYDLAAQTRVMDALRGQGQVPVPTVLWHETDVAVIGREFVVMERVDGRIPSDNPGYHFEGWLKDLDSSEQRRHFDSTIEVLASVHRLDWAAAGLGFLPGIGLEREFAYWGEYLDWAADGERFEAIDAAFAWCVEHRPEIEPSPSLVWGDTRLGNIVFAPDVDDEPLLRAVLDWEMASLGPAELDLGWYLFLERTALQFAPQLAGFPDRPGTIAAYQRALGRSVMDIDWYEIWGGVRSAAIMIRVASNLAALGVVRPEFRGDNPVTQLLTRLIS
jgi:aminoglycoside phosphotransferase (APT) family kinase protein